MQESVINCRGSRSSQKTLPHIEAPDYGTGLALGSIQATSRDIIGSQLQPMTTAREGIIYLSLANSHLTVMFAARSSAATTRQLLRQTPRRFGSHSAHSEPVNESFGVSCSFPAGSTHELAQKHGEPVMAAHCMSISANKSSSVQ